jgi:hypothetical protein
MPLEVQPWIPMNLPSLHPLAHHDASPLDYHLIRIGTPLFWLSHRPCYRCMKGLFACEPSLSTLLLT